MPSRPVPHTAGVIHERYAEHDEGRCGGAVATLGTVTADASLTTGSPTRVVADLSTTGAPTRFGEPATLVGTDGDETYLVLGYRGSPLPVVADLVAGTVRRIGAGTGDVIRIGHPASTPTVFYGTAGRDDLSVGGDGEDDADGGRGVNTCVDVETTTRCSSQAPARRITSPRAPASVE